MSRLLDSHTVDRHVKVPPALIEKQESLLQRDIFVPVFCLLLILFFFFLSNLSFNQDMSFLASYKCSLCVFSSLKITNGVSLVFVCEGDRMNSEYSLDTQIGIRQIWQWLRHTGTGPSMELFHCKKS